MELKKGSHVRVLTAECDKDKTDETTIWVDYPNLPQVLQKDSKIYIDDGLIGLKVLAIGKSLVFVGESEALTRDQVLLVLLLLSWGSSARSHKGTNSRTSGPASQSKRVSLYSGAILQRLQRYAHNEFGIISESLMEALQTQSFLQKTKML